MILSALTRSSVNAAVTISAPRLLATAATMSGLHSLVGTKGDGSEVKMSDFAGKVIYATNVASK